jgi:beta-xylosidase
VPIFRSANLVDWTQIGNVLDRRSQLDLRSTQGDTSLGVFSGRVIGMFASEEPAAFDWFEYQGLE